MRQFNLKMTHSQIMAVQEAAHAAGLNTSEYIRDLLAQHVPNWPQDEITWGGYRPDKIMIDVTNGQARMVRVPRVQQAGWKFEEALNSDELADEAAEAVSAQGGHITLSGQYPCPPALAKKAVWT
jgi:hypothetical protein